MSDWQIVRKTGAEMATVFYDLARLRIAVFRDFPYLYEGSLAYEASYLATYAQSDRAFLCAVMDRGNMVGATTCIPLEDETPEVQAPFLEAGYQIDQIFYFGESILLPPYRGKGLGKLFFDEREAHVTACGNFQMTCFCAVERPPNHPLRPADYQPLDIFWGKRGYKIAPDLKTSFSWKDIDEPAPSAKPMVFWLKTWHSHREVVL